MTPRGSPPFRTSVDLLVQKLTKDNNSFVADAEMFLCPIHDRPLRFPSHRILNQHMIEAILAFLIPDRENIPTARRRPPARDRCR